MHIEVIIDKEVIASVTKELPGFIVIDTTWKRMLNLTPEGWLGTASEDYPIAVFNTESEAEKAIQKTLAFDGGIYEWQKNKYIVIPYYRKAP